MNLGWRENRKPTAQIHKDLQLSKRRYRIEDILIYIDLWKNRCGSFTQGLKCEIYHVCTEYNEDTYAIFWLICSTTFLGHSNAILKEQICHYLLVLSAPKQYDFLYCVENKIRCLEVCSFCSPLKNKNGLGTELLEIKVPNGSSLSNAVEELCLVP